MSETYFLEDFVVGQVFASGQLAVSAEDIKAFAALYDPQPFHLDEAAAQGSFFQGLAASGWHTAALSMRLIVDGEAPVGGGLIGGGGEITWPTPTRPGDILTVVTTVLEVTPSRSRPNRGVVVMRNETKNQHGEIRQVTVMKTLAFRRPGP